jgi:hypothetical protein
VTGIQVTGTSTVLIHHTLSEVQLPVTVVEAYDYHSLQFFLLLKFTALLLSQLKQVQYKRKYINTVL